MHITLLQIQSLFLSLGYVLNYLVATSLDQEALLQFLVPASITIIQASWEDALVTKLKMVMSKTT